MEIDEALFPGYHSYQPGRADRVRFSVGLATAPEICQIVATRSQARKTWDRI